MNRFPKFFLVTILLLAVFSAGQLATYADEAIGSVTVTANKTSYTGKCPTTIKFTGKIEVNKFPMSLNYHWERSDGAKTAVKVVHVKKGTKTLTVVDTWKLGAAGKHVDGWVKLIVNSGNTHITSDPANFTLDCK